MRRARPMRRYALSDQQWETIWVLLLAARLTSE